jgi:hypothetical protein
VGSRYIFLSTIPIILQTTLDVQHYKVKGNNGLGKGTDRAEFSELSRCPKITWGFLVPKLEFGNEK